MFDLVKFKLSYNIGHHEVIPNLKKSSCHSGDHSFSSRMVKRYKNVCFGDIQPNLLGHHVLITRSLGHI